jgi:hypothetical protein
MEKIFRFNEFSVLESLPQQHTVDQLKKVKKTMNKEIGGDIGDKISDSEKKSANVYFFRNPIETGIESYQDFEKSNRKKYGLQPKRKRN